MLYCSQLNNSISNRNNTLPSSSKKSKRSCSNNSCNNEQQTTNTKQHTNINNNNYNYNNKLVQLPKYSPPPARLGQLVCYTLWPLHGDVLSNRGLEGQFE